MPPLTAGPASRKRVRFRQHHAYGSSLVMEDAAVLRMKVARRLRLLLRRSGYSLLQLANPGYGRGADGPATLLARALARPIEWEQSEQCPTGILATLFSQTPGAHKWHHYLEIYEELFSPLRDRAIRLLEIGVYQGASLQVWSDYFHPDSTLVGIDIDPGCSKLERIRPNVSVRIGSQNDEAFLKQVMKEFGPFDLIIDDGSHISSHLIQSFNALFDTGLKDGGLYLAEDLHTNRWATHQDTEVTFLDFCHALVELLHAPYAERQQEELFRKQRFREPGPLLVPRITSLVREIRFWDSVVAIKKQSHPAPQSQHW